MVYMVVDKVEGELELVYWINVEVLGVMVEEVELFGVMLVYYLIDYVYDGFKLMLYVELDLIVLGSVYG